ncbi:alpha/beta hydrolase [Lysobacter sp. HA35]
MRLLRWSVLLVAASALLACVPTRADLSKPVPTALLPSKAGSHRLVVVLPGRRDRLESLRRSGVGEAIQRVWPDADVLFAELSMPYYLDRSAPRRLHDEVLMPARRRAYTEIWLVGASLGGMGGILYDGMYPGQVDGMVLLAPYTGERDIHDEIRAAGGLDAWQPSASTIDEKNLWQRDLWAQMKTWKKRARAHAQRVARLRRQRLPTRRNAAGGRRSAEGPRARAPGQARMEHMDADGRGRLPRHRCRARATRNGALRF